MKTADIVVAGFLSVMVLTTFISCCALILFQDKYQRMHYLSVVTTISTLSLLVAVAIKEGWGQATLKTILSFIVLLLVNAVVTHATARAARVREYGNWLPGPEERIPGAEGGK